MSLSRNPRLVLKKVISPIPSDKETKERFLKRVKEGKLSREEDPLTHFCVYFAAFDPKVKQVFIGQHIKSGLWLFNGGHLEKGEEPKEAVKREIIEEWGKEVKLPKIPVPELLTLTKIENPEKQICRYHYDIWYFFPVDKNKFSPDQDLLTKEFYEIGWKTLKEAKKLAKDFNTLLALKTI